MAQKRSLDESIEIPSKVAKLEKTCETYLLPIDFVRGTSSPCITQIAAALFNVKEKRCVSECLIIIGKENVHQSNENQIIVANFQEALNELSQCVHRHCPHSTITMVTKDHKSIRNGLHHELIHARVDQNIAMDPLWWKYFELEHFSSNAKDAKIDLKSQTVNWMCAIIEEYLSEGRPIGSPIQIQQAYSHAIIPEGAIIPSNTVIEIHQLPWTATPFSIAVFFRGLNIRPGGIAIKIAEGRRSNTAYVTFESELDAQLACERTTQEDNEVLTSLEGALASQNTRQTGVQIAMASDVLYLQYAVCRYPDIAQFLHQLTDERQIVVRVRGLPYSTKKSDIVNFFDQVEAHILNDEDGIFFATYADCRPTGDAFVLFVDNLDADRALTRHRNYLGQRYVEVFKASPSEAVQVCQSAQQNGAPGNTKVAGLVGKSQRVPSITGTIKDTTGTNNMSSSATTVVSSHTLSSNLTLPEMPPMFINPLLFPSSFIPPQLPSGLPSTTDLNDPTDPKSLFPRPLPPRGARFVLQILDLPANLSRQEMRLFLGTEVLSKVFRMCRITTCLNESSWLLLLAHISDAVFVLEELLRRSVSSLSPRFILFEMEGRDFQLNLISPNKLPSYLPSARVVNLRFAVEPNIRSCVPQISGVIGMEPQMTTLPQILAQQPSIGAPLEIPSFITDFANSCVLQITGLPKNVTQQELLSLYAPVMHLLSIPPQFLPVPSSDHDVTTTYIAVFGNRTDVALVLAHCRLCALRGNMYIAITTTLGQAPLPISFALPDFSAYLRSSKLI